MPDTKCENNYTITTSKLRKEQHWHAHLVLLVEGCQEGQIVVVVPVLTRRPRTHHVHLVGRVLPAVVVAVVRGVGVVAAAEGLVQVLVSPALVGQVPRQVGHIAEGVCAPLIDRLVQHRQNRRTMTSNL